MNRAQICNPSVFVQLINIMAGRAFLSFVFQVIHERLSSSYFRDYFNDGLVKIFEITLDSINEVLDDAEVKQYQNLDVKNWLDDLKHEVYEVDQLLDVIAADAQPKGNIQRILSLFINRGFEARIEALIQKVEFLAEKKDRLGLQASNKDGVTPRYCQMHFGWMMIVPYMVESMRKRK